jgi:hypothetical protein
MNEIKVSREHYHRMSVNLLDTFAHKVSNNVYVLNPTRWTTPPMIQTDFDDIIEDFELTRSAFVGGGDDQKGPYEDALALLMTTLDTFADMVDGYPSLTPAIVGEGGFVSTKESDSEHHVPDGGKGVVNLRRAESTGVIIADCTVVPEAEFYQAILSTTLLTDARIMNSDTLVLGKNDSIVSIKTSKQRKKTFEGLTAGTIYYVYYFISNAQGTSQLTEVRSIMAV